MSFSHGHMSAVPRHANASYLDFRARQSMSSPHNGGTNVVADVEYNRPLFAGAGQVMVRHAYDGTETGVAEGLEKPL